MFEAVKRAARAALNAATRAVRRFFANKPANQYERVVFNAVREMAHTFGKVAFT